MSYGCRGDSGTMSRSFSDIRSSGSSARAIGGLLLAVRGEVGEVVLHRADAFLVVLHLQVADSRLPAVDLGAAELLHRDVLSCDRLRQMRPGERHRALADDHRDEVRERRDVGGPRSAGSEHRRDHRNHARHHDLLLEEMAGAREQRSRRLLDPRPGRVKQPDERHPLRQRHLAQAAHLQLAGHPHRAGHHGEVVGGDAAGAAVDVAPPGDHPVSRRLYALHRFLGEVRPSVDPHLHERAGIAEEIDPLAGGELPALVLEGDLLLAAAELRPLSPRVEVLGQPLHPGRLATLDHIRRFLRLARAFRGLRVLLGLVLRRTHLDLSCFFFLSPSDISL